MESCGWQVLHIAGQEHNDGAWSVYDQQMPVARRGGRIDPPPRARANPSGIRRGGSGRYGAAGVGRSQEEHARVGGGGRGMGDGGGEGRGRLATEEEEEEEEETREEEEL